MADLKKFVKEKNVESAAPRKETATDEEKARDAWEQARRLQGKSQSELLSSLLEATETGRRDGSFSQESLQRFMQTVSPLLNAAQRARLDEIAKMIEKRE